MARLPCSPSGVAVAPSVNSRSCEASRSSVQAIPDWVQINFSGDKSINRVVVYSLQDNYDTTGVVEPTDTMTGAKYVLVDFTVQG